MTIQREPRRLRRTGWPAEQHFGEIDNDIDHLEWIVGDTEGRLRQELKNQRAMISWLLGTFGAAFIASGMAVILDVFKG